jgi:hypothetical protein
MRPSLPALVRVIRRSELLSRIGISHSKDASEKIRIIPPPPSHHELKKRQVTIIDTMRARQREGNETGTWPSNLRIEPIVTSKTLSGLKPGAKGRLRGLLKEV